MAALMLAGGAGSWPGGLGSPRGTSAGAATSCRQGGQPARSGRCRGGQGRNGDDLYDRAGKSRPPVPPRLLGSAVVRGVDTLGAGLGAGSPIPRGPAPTGLSPFISSLFAKPAPVFLTFSSGLLPAVRNMKSISPKSAQNTVQTNVFLAASLIQKSSLWLLVRPERCPARPGVRGSSPRLPTPSLERVIGSWHLLAPARTLHEYQLTYLLLNPSRHVDDVTSPAFTGVKLRPRQVE